MVDRRAAKPYTIPPETPTEKPLHLEVGAEVQMPLFMMQRDANYFPEPEKFDPELFSDENKQKIVSGTYFPFGLGPRTCIGRSFAGVSADPF